MYIVIGNILNVSTVHLNRIWHLIWRYLSKPVLGGHYSIPRGCPLNTGFTVIPKSREQNKHGRKNVSQKVTWTTEFQHVNRTTFFLWLWGWLPHRLPKRQSPGRSYWTKLWNDSWGQTFHSFSILSFLFAEKRINIRHQSHPYIHWLEIRREKRVTDHLFLELSTLTDRVNWETRWNIWIHEFSWI